MIPSRYRLGNSDGPGLFGPEPLGNYYQRSSVQVRSFFKSDDLAVRARSRTGLARVVLGLRSLFWRGYSDAAGREVDR